MKTTVTHYRMSATDELNRTTERAAEETTVIEAAVETMTKEKHAGVTAQLDEAGETLMFKPKVKPKKKKRVSPKKQHSQYPVLIFSKDLNCIMQWIPFPTIKYSVWINTYFNMILESKVLTFILCIVLYR